MTFSSKIFCLMHTQDISHGNSHFISLAHLCIPFPLLEAKSQQQLLSMFWRAARQQNFSKNLSTHIYNPEMIMFSLQSCLRKFVSLERAFHPTCRKCQQSHSRQNHNCNIKHFILQRTHLVPFPSHTLALGMTMFNQTLLKGWA